MTALERHEPRTTKGEATRERILRCALRLFEEHGFEGTTMRGIAEEAGVALGNTYYYYRSKEHLIQAFYATTTEAHAEAAHALLARHRRFESRLAHVMHARIEVSQRYHRFAGVLFRTAADPESPLHPLSEASQPVREQSTEIFRELIEGSREKVPRPLEPILPELLWLYQMGVILYWVHDRSEGCAQTRLLIDRTAKMLAILLRLSGSIAFRPVVRLVVATYRELSLLPLRA